jgi:hypothetical protein
MTDTETPIEAGARALHGRIYGEISTLGWDVRGPGQREQFLGDARAVFESVDIIGMTKVLSAHPTWRLRGCCPDDDWYICSGCGAEIETALAHVDAEFRDHQAVAVIAWLGGGA